MMYSEAAYFDGNHCQHVADYQDARYRAARRDRATASVERRTGSRARAGR